VLIIASEDFRVKEVGEALELRLGVKSGGKGPRWSGKWVRAWRPTKEGEVVGEMVRGIPT
jgi:misacylated tRNA(Ala) deacylase